MLYRQSSAQHCFLEFADSVGVPVQGVITQHPTGTEDYSIRGKFKVPINFHVGSMGLAQATDVTINSVVPMMGGQRSFVSAVISHVSFAKLREEQLTR